MWSNLPSDLLSHIFSFLPPDCLARAGSTCRRWHVCSKWCPPSLRRHPPWLLALPLRNHKLCCHAYNPCLGKWYDLPLSFLRNPVRPVAAIGGLLLSRPTNSTVLRLDICNPFTKQFRPLPALNIARTKPALGVVVVGPSPQGPFPHFRVYVAGGMSEAPRGGSTFESTLEMYDSRDDRWHIVGSAPQEFAVRLTVWTPNEGVYSSGAFYWVTSARAYSVMGFEIATNAWRELDGPAPAQLEFASLGRRHGKLTLVGGSCGDDARVWELGKGDKWEEIAKVPMEMKVKLLGETESWINTMCASSDGCVCLYQDLGSGMAIWKEVVEKGTWDWFWVDGSPSIRGSKVLQNVVIKGMFLHPNIAPWP